MGKVTVSANGLSVVHKKSGGKAMCTIPDVCKVPFPPPVGTVPLPFPNIAESKNLTNGSIITQFDGGSVALLGSSISKSSGDEMGKAGGIISGCNKGEAFFIGFSPNVQVEMRPVCRKSDMLIMNKINTIALTGMDQDDVGDVKNVEARDEMETKPFKMQFQEGFEAKAKQPFKVVAKGNVIKGETDNDGKIEIEIPKTCRTLKIKIADNPPLTVELLETKPQGKKAVQQQLANLGFYQKSEMESKQTVMSLATQFFQEVVNEVDKEELKVDGDPGPITEKKIKEKSGS